MPPTLNRRNFVATLSSAGLAAGLGSFTLATADEKKTGRNDVVRVGCIGIRGKGSHHMSGLEGVEGAEVVALCDIDASVLGPKADAWESRTPGRKVKRFSDYRKLVEDPDIDAVSIATCNHTHTLIAIAAMEAGKDVYVEKPCSHNLWEGRQLVAAARKYQRMCQHGTQGRSSPAIREAIQKLGEGVIGEIYMARGLCFKWRPSIGRTPDEPVPAGVNYDLWLGPAPERPFSRNRFHYNWHWHWDYGNGDMGNQGVHEMDMARWGLGVGMPKRVHAGGGHFMFDDDQETPNTLVCIYEYPDENKMLVFETRHWITNQEDFGSGGSNAVGVTFYGSEGYMQVYYFGYKTFLGKNREPGPTGTGAPNEYERFIAGVRSRKHEDLGVEIEDGHLSSALCHLGNIAYRLKRTVNFDPKTETFGNDQEANALLTRDYRKPYVVPKIA
ncbi:MAG: Gfo/Idh/MocA family oxidoreductase [Pirellulales bacterium]|nr:Gfo/Idh/MocA family oxidoreductase [Pirellulales bacterium]